MPVAWLQVRVSEGMCLKRGSFLVFLSSRASWGFLLRSR